MCGGRNLFLPPHHTNAIIKLNEERKSKVDDNKEKMQSIKWLGVELIILHKLKKEVE